MAEEIEERGSRPWTALSERVIGLAIEVHRHLGPGLLESTYEDCLCFELQQAAIPLGGKFPCLWSTKRSSWSTAIEFDILVEDDLSLRSNP